MLRVWKPVSGLAGSALSGPAICPGWAIESSVTGKSIDHQDNLKGLSNCDQLESCGRNRATNNCQTLRRQPNVVLHPFNSQHWGGLKQEDRCDFKVSTDYLVILSQNIRGGAGEIAQWVKSWLCKQEDLSLILKDHMNSWVRLDL